MAKKCKSGMKRQNGKCVWKNSTWMNAPQCKSGMGFLGFFLALLAILFITLKLLNIDPVASWSWFWVLSPILIPIIIVIIITIIFIVIFRKK